MVEEAIESVSVVINTVLHHPQEEAEGAERDPTLADPTAQIERVEVAEDAAEREATHQEESTLTEAQLQDPEEEAAKEVETVDAEREARTLETAEM